MTLELFTRAELRLLLIGLDYISQNEHEQHRTSVEMADVAVLRARLIARADCMPGYPGEDRDDPRVTPSACEHQLAYELMRPTPWSKSPVRHAAEIVCGYREGIAQRLLEPLAQRLPPQYAAQVRAVIAVMRGEMKESEIP